MVEHHTFWCVGCKFLSGRPGFDGAHMVVATRPPSLPLSRVPQPWPVSGSSPELAEDSKES